MAKAKVKTTEVNEKKFNLKNAPFDTAMPDGFNFNDHTPLKRDAFEKEQYYFEHRALYHESRAALMREQAAFAEKYGSKKQRQQVKRVEKLTSEIEELRKTLEASGVDVEAILAMAVSK